MLIRGTELYKMTIIVSQIHIVKRINNVNEMISKKKFTLKNKKKH